WKTRPSRAGTPGRWQPQLEPLEGREAPACNVMPPPTLTVTCDGANDVVTLDRVSDPTGMWLVAAGPNNRATTHPENGRVRDVISTDGGQDTVNVEATMRPVTVNAGAGNDQVHVSPGAQDLSTLREAVTADGGADNNVITIYDQHSGFGGTYTLSGDGGSG